MLRALVLHLLLGAALFAQRQRTTAEVVLEEAPTTLLARGAAAAGVGDFVTAKAAWDAVFPRLEAAPKDKLAPLLIHARLQAGDATGALTLAREWLASAEPKDARRALVESVVVEALGETGEAMASLEALRSLERLTPRPPEAAELRFRVVEWLADAGRTTEALSELEPLLGSTVPLHATRARGRRVAIAVADADFEPEELVKIVRSTLDAPPFSPGTALAADNDVALLETCRALAGAIDRVEWITPSLALRIARTLPPPMEIGARLRACAANLLTSSGEVRMDAGRRSAGDRALKDALLAEALPDPSPSLRLRQARLLIRLDRPREAWLRAEALALDETLPTEVRDAAFHAWVASALALNRWEDSLVIVGAHEERFPLSPHLDEMLSLAAHAHLGAKRWADAIACLDRILSRTPSPQLQARSRLLRGNACLRAGLTEQADEDFLWLQRNGPDLVWQARGRHLRLVALALARRHEAVLELCSHYTSEGIDVAGDAALEHRRILALRSLKRQQEAEQGAVDWLERHAGEPQTDEMLLLVGCLAVERGDAAGAKRFFGKLSKEAEGPKAHAAFQLGRLLRASEDWESLLRHFRAYTDGAPRDLPRLAEAFHWQAYALDKMQRPNDAGKVWTEALDRFGDDPRAIGMDAVLAGCLRMERTASARGIWLESMRKAALAAERPTLYARLTLALAAVEARAGRRGLAGALTEQVAVTVSDDRLDAAGLLATALAEEAFSPEAAARRLDRILTLHSKSMEALEASVARARLHLAAGWTHEARELLTAAATNEGHPRVALAKMELADLKLSDTEWQEASELARAVLANRGARGRLHARALFTLARCESGLARPEAALALYQRVFTLHRSQSDLAGASYLEAARILTATGRANEAAQTLQELVRIETSGFERFAETARGELARSHAVAPRS